MVTDVNEAPRFAEASDGITRIQRSVPENTAAGTNIGPPVSATDPDGSEVPLRYSLSGTNADMFEIDRDIGQLKTKSPLDYEILDYLPPAYFVNVQASDGVMSTETEVRVDVEPVNEFAPVFTEGDNTTREIDEKVAIGTNVGAPVSATDSDMGETLEYSLTDNKDGVFGIDNYTSQLTTAADLDHKTKPSYTVKVVASDGSRTSSILVTINVLPETSTEVEVASAPTIHTDKVDVLSELTELKTLDRDGIQAQLQRLYAESNGSLQYRRAITLLKGVLALMLPEKTALLVNYPNPFNPETWIPYRLAKAADVQILIYGPHGNIVRHLDLGHQSAGDYINTSRAAYWDGKNDFGERVSSGIYFYQLQANTISPCTKWLS